MAYLIQNGFWIRDRVRGYNYLYPSLAVACERAWQKQATATHMCQFSVRFQKKRFCVSDYGSAEELLQACLEALDKLHAA